MSCGTAVSPLVDVQADELVLAASPRGRTAGCGRPRGRCSTVAVDADRDDVAGDLALELVGRALGDDQPVVDDRQAVGERVGLLEVVGRQEDVVPRSRRPRISSHMRARACGSRPVVGSSRNRTAGRWTMPSPTSSRRRMPPEYVPVAPVGGGFELEGGEDLGGPSLARRLVHAVQAPLEDQLAAAGLGRVGRAALRHVADPAADLGRFGAGRPRPRSALPWSA